MFFCLYYFSSFVLFIISCLSFFWGMNFLMKDILVFLDWEFLCFGPFSLTLTLLFDWMSLFFMGCVFMISSMVVLYSSSYMSGDLNKIRFLFLVLLFVFSMMMMILSPNMVSILIGWDGLGLISYALVIYFQNWKSYNSGMLTILTNRIGDVCILLCICWFLNFGDWNFFYILGLSDSFLIYVFMLVILAGFTKSAQIPFSSWLPAAMAAPTPVSALVHSSTLVTAGVYLLIRFYNLLCNYDCSLFVYIGIITMFMSGLGAMFEFDLKKVIALSTLSQLGLMFSILFMGYPILSFFHLLTHAFFKALLFLCAGLIIHVMGDSQDIRHMGCSVVFLPITCICFSISSLSLCGFPFLSGFYSKDMILEVLSMNYYNLFSYILFFFSIGFTVIYSVRLVYYCVFSFGNKFICQWFLEDKIMNFSMVLLVFFSIFIGSFFNWLIFPIPYFIYMPLYMKVLPLIFIFSSFLIGYLFCSFSFSSMNLFLIYFLSLMWFMPNISTLMLYSKGFLYSSVLSLNMDSGWGEYLISSSFKNYFIYLSNFNFYFQLNNFKLYLIMFFFMFIMFMY